jgi:hypothetical protein
MQTQTVDKKIVLKAIDSLDRRVTAADVASKTGLPLLPVMASLNQIAAETDGHMEVGEKGEIAYKFSPGFQSKYAVKGIQEKLQKIWKAVFKVGFFLVRISFGIMLILNALIIVLLVFVVILWYQQRSGDDDDGYGGGRGGGYGGGGFFPFHFSFFDYLILRDILWGTSYGTDYRRYDYSTPTVRKNKDGNFFFNAFSFLFGDGDPNQNHEEHKWSMIAEVIRRNHGVVTSEQLAPYLGSEPSDEDAVLPVLVRFNGKPEVTEDGDIVYIFDDMQVTASAVESPFHHRLPSYLSEWTWKFTNVPPGQMMMVYILAGFNFLGSIFLVGQLAAMEASRYGNPLAGFAPLIHFLLISATLFIAVPFCRWIVLNFKNGAIAERNAKRLANSKLLENPPEKVLKKLGNAQRMSLDTRRISENNTVFTTEKDSLEQEFDASP